MADNVTLNSGSGGSVIKTDDDGTAHWQYVKVAYGADNTQTRVTSSVGLPVSLLAGTAAIGKLAANSGVDIGDVDVTSIAAGENHLGEIGGNTTTIQVTPTTTATPDYSALDNFGGKLTLTNAMRVSGGTGILHAITVKSEDTLAASDLDVVIFNSDPSTSTLTDNSATAVADADLGKVLGVVSLTDLFTIDAASVVLQATNIGLPVVASGSANLYAACIARAAINLAVTDGITIDFHFLRD